MWNVKYSKERKGFQTTEAPMLVANPHIAKLFWGNEHWASQTNSHPVSRIAFAGDQGALARDRLMSMLTARYQQTPSMFSDAKLNLEPFEVIRDMLRESGKSHTIGGAPQMVKVYQHMNTRPVAVLWPDAKTGAACIQGRPLLGYENMDLFTLDPDTLKTSRLKPGVANGSGEANPL